MFRLLLYNLGIIKLNTLKNKLEYLSYKGFNPYADNLINLQLDLIGNNIIEYCDVLEIILKDNLLEKTLDYNFNYTTKEVSLGIWCSDNKKYIPDIDIIINRFLELAIKVNNHYVLLTNNKNKFLGKPLYNAKKIHPHIINIEKVISKIINRSNN